MIGGDESGGGALVAWRWMPRLASRLGRRGAALDVVQVSVVGCAHRLMPRVCSGEVVGEAYLIGDGGDGRRRREGGGHERGGAKSNRSGGVVLKPYGWQRRRCEDRRSGEALVRWWLHVVNLVLA